MATLREFLDDVAFDWDGGLVVYQPVTSGSYSPGWGTAEPGRLIGKNDPILDFDFDAGYGALNCPRFFARDGKAVYFPVQYDGATCPERVVIAVEEYTRTDGKHRETPYPGG